MLPPDPKSLTAALSQPSPADTDSSPNTRAAAPRTAFDSAAHPSLAPPQQPDEIGRLGRFRVLAVLGHGGMGLVYHADDPTLNRAVALKVMLPKYAADPHARARFLREARAQARVEHDHVAPIWDVVDDGATPFLAMPLLKGLTLAEALKANPRPPVAVVVRLGREIAQGLAAAHEQGLIHRDIKPGNVWLEGRKLRVRILDFGLARAAAEPEAATPDDGPLTAKGAIVGTPHYMSPEQAQGLAVDPRTDLFSLGVVLYQMAVGRLPFTGTSTAAVLTAVVTDHPTGLVEVQPPLTLVLIDLIMRLLAKGPAGRPSSAEDVAEELEQIERGLTAAVGMQVIPLDAGGANPFADIDTNETEAEGEPMRSSRGGAKLVLVAGVLGLFLIAGLVWVAAKKMKGTNHPVVKGDEPKQGDSKPPPTPPKETNSQPPAVPPLFFNGKDLTGWDGDPSVWMIDKGDLVGAYKSGPLRGDSTLTSRSDHRDFELSFRVRVDGAAEPGVIFRADGEAPGRPWRFKRWAEVKLGAKAGSLSRELRLVMGADLAAVAATRTGDFDAVTVRCVGRQVRVTVNGSKALDGEFPLPEAGRVGWSLLHGATVRIKDIQFTDLNRQAEVDRRIAERILNAGGQLTLRFPDQSMVNLSPGARIPDQPFRFKDIRFENSSEPMAAVTALEGLADLEYSLTMAGPRITDDVVDRLTAPPGLPPVRQLSIPCSQLTDAGVAHLKRLKGVTRLNLSAMWDAGLVHLRDIKGLGYLSVNGPLVTDSGLHHLVAIPDLTTLELLRTKVTKVGVEKLAAAVPRCVIVWDGGRIEAKEKVP